MGFGFYELPDGREAGYAVSAQCDEPGCIRRIDRGLDYLCGDQPDGHRDPAEPGCGRYFCHEYGHHATHECPNPGRSHADYLDVPELREALSAAQDEIERRITECEGHRALIDAVRAERAAETEWDQLTVGFHGWSEKESEVFRRLSTARRHRRAVVDSIGGS